MPPEIRSHTDGNKEEDCTEARCQEDDDSLDEEANCNEEVGGEEDHGQEGNCQAVPEEKDCYKESYSEKDDQKDDGKAVSQKEDRFQEQDWRKEEVVVFEPGARATD
jgi:hypothetical protein